MAKKEGGEEARKEKEKAADRDAPMPDRPLRLVRVGRNTMSHFRSTVSLHSPFVPPRGHRQPYEK